MPLAVGIQRTKLRWTLFEGRNSGGFRGFIRNTLRVDLFGIPNPRFLDDGETTEDLRVDNSSDVTLDIEDQ